MKWKQSQGEIPEYIRKGDQELSSAVQIVTSKFLSRISNGSHKVKRRYRYLPMVALETSQNTLATILADSNVRAVFPDIPTPLPGLQSTSMEGRQKLEQLSSFQDISQPSLSTSVDLIGANRVWAKGYTGAGWYVAILDTGIRRTHAFFQNKDIIEACFSDSDCPNGQDEMTGTGAATHHPSHYSGHDHGTHVSGIAAGRTDGSLNGVAKDADLIAVNVFSTFEEDEWSGNYPAVLSYTSDQLAGLDFVYGLRDSHKIGGVNMSLGGGKKSCYCDGDPRKSAIDRLRDVNIPTSIATGNNSYCGAITAPACISTAIAVMASDKTDAEASFSNWSSTLADIFAPGVSILSSTGDTDCSYEYWSGTSMATPHVTGALTLMRQFNPEASPEENLSKIKEHGPSIQTNCNSDESEIRVYADNVLHCPKKIPPCILQLLLE